MHDRPLKRLLIILPLLALASCAGQGREPETVRFTILYTADTHGHVASSRDTIGLDQVAGVKKALEPSLLLDAGDFSDGTPEAVLDRGESMVALMQKAGYFAAALGNHEFTYGRDVLARRMAQAAAPPDSMAILSANVVKPDGTLLAAASARTTLAGVSICVYGLTTPETRTQASPSIVADLEFAAPVRASRDTVHALRASGCEVVVALAHIGSDGHAPVTGFAVAEATPGLDIMVDGHSHKELERTTATGTLVVSPGALGRKLGRLDVEYDRARGKIVSLANTLLTPRDAAIFPADAALAEDIAALGRKTAAELAVPVGETLYDLDGGQNAVRTRETNLGNLCADSIRTAHGADFALVNGGSIRDSLREGPVTGRDILSVLPFTGNIVSFRVTGAELKEMLEHGLSFLPDAYGAFPQVSGLVVHIRTKAPQGRRVEHLFFADGRPVSMKKSYTVAVNSFLAEGGDGYAALAGKTRLMQYGTPQDALRNHLRLTGTEPYAPGPPQRLIFLP